MLSGELFHGDEIVTFHEAVLALDPLRKKRDTSRLEAIINEIRADIETQGGLTEKQIDQLVKESRERRRAQNCCRQSSAGRLALVYV
jgi:hypothetical protein